MVTIKAKDGMYLTQASLENEESRIFVREITGASVKQDDWKDATPQEKADWEDKYIKPIE